jgi:hypothetical protein
MAKDEAPAADRRRSDDEPWYIDRRIPLAVIAALVFQGASILWYAANMSAKVEDHERRLVTQEATLTGPQGLSERLTRVEEKQSAAQKSLDRIETILATPADGSGHRK